MAAEFPDVGTVIFGGLTTFTMVAAGVASAAPARHPTIGWGGLIVFLAWLAAVLNLLGNLSRFAALEVVLADAAIMAAFFSLSRRSPTDPVIGFFYRDWAAFAVALMAAILLLEVFNLLLVQAGDWKAHGLAALLAGAGFVSFGFLRGYGWRLFLAAVVFVSAILAAAAFTYVRVVNFLTLVLIALIGVVATRVAAQNIRAWMRHARNHSRPL